MRNADSAKNQPIRHIAQDYIYKDKLTLNQGIWQASEAEAVSYPEDSRDMLFELEDKSFWFQHRNTCIIELMKHYPPQGTVFDVGGGNGFVSKGMHNAGYDVVLVEPGVGGALNARKRGGFDIVCAPFSKRYFKQNSAKAVALFDVIEHIQNDTDFLQEIHSLMQTGGHLYLTVPAYMSLWSQEDEAAGHFRRYTRKALQELLKTTGFEVLYDSYIFGYLPLPILFVRTLTYKFGFNRKGLSSNVKRELTIDNAGGIASKILSKLNTYEINRIKKGKYLYFGGSLLLIAKKRDK